MLPKALRGKYIYIYIERERGVCQYSSQGAGRCVRALALAMAGSTEGLVGDFLSEGYLDAHVRKLKVAYGNSRPLSFFSGLEFCDESQWQRFIGFWSR